MNFRDEMPVPLEALKLVRAAFEPDASEQLKEEATRMLNVLADVHAAYVIALKEAGLVVEDPNESS